MYNLPSEHHSTLQSDRKENIKENMHINIAETQSYPKCWYENISKSNTHSISLWFIAIHNLTIKAILHAPPQPH